MASYYVEYGHSNKGSYNFTVEFLIPMVDKTYGLTNKTLYSLLIADVDNDKTSKLATTAEVAKLADGSLVKVVKNVKINSGQSASSIKAVIRSMYNSLAISVPKKLNRRYKGYSFSETKGVDF